MRYFLIVALLAIFFEPYAQRSIDTMEIDHIVASIDENSQLFNQDAVQCETGSMSKSYFMDPTNKELAKFQLSRSNYSVGDSNSLRYVEYRSTYYYRNGNLIKVENRYLYKRDKEYWSTLFYYSKEDNQEKFGICTPDVPDKRGCLYYGKQHQKEFKELSSKL